METDAVTDKLTCYMLFRKFIQEVRELSFITVTCTSDSLVNALRF